MEIDVKKHKARAVLPNVIGVIAVLTWFGGFIWATQVPDALAPAVLGASFTSGVLLLAVGEILDAVRNTRYLTALMAAHMLNGVSPEGDQSAQRPSGPMH